MSEGRCGYDKTRSQLGVKKCGEGQILCSIFEKQGGGSRQCVFYVSGLFR